MIEIHEFTGCYALDALDPTDLADFQAHLASCGDCGHEVTDFFEAAAELTLLTEARPPRSLRETVLSAVRSTPQLPTSPPVNAPAAPQVAGSDHAAGLPDPKARDEQAVRALTESVRLHRQWRRNRLLTGVVAAMLALLVGLGGVAYTQFQQRQAQVAQITLENDLYRAPDTETVVVDLSGGGRATFVVSRLLNRAMFLGSDLPDPGPGDRYTLWTATGPSLKASTGVVLDNQVPERGARSKQLFRGDIAHADFLALNIEPAGSSPAVPTTPVLAATRI